MLYIKYSLKSIYPYCNEIIVVDNASVDATVKIIEDFILNEDNEKNDENYKEPKWVIIVSYIIIFCIGVWMVLSFL